MAADRRQNVVVKVAYVSRFATKAMGRNFQTSMAKHESYIEREGSGLDGQPPGKINSEGKRNEQVEPLKEIPSEPRFYKVILSPERGADLDLGKYTERVMSEVSQRTGLSLVWKAAVHHNTDNPHVHVIIRGVTADGKEVNLKAFSRAEFRSVARDIATEELGLRSERDLVKERQRTIIASRETWIDRKIEQRIDREGFFHPTGTTESLRVAHLQKIGLAEPGLGGKVYIDPSFVSKLRELGTRGDIQKTMYNLGLKDVTIAKSTASIDGVVIRKDVKNELYETSFVVLRDHRGKLFYFDGKGVESVKSGDTVSLNQGRLSRSDREQGRDFSLERGLGPRPGPSFDK